MDKNYIDTEIRTYIKTSLIDHKESLKVARKNHAKRIIENKVKLAKFDSADWSMEQQKSQLKSL